MSRILCTQKTCVEAEEASCSDSLGSTCHSLLYTLHAFQPLNALLMKYVHVQFLYDLDNHVQALEKSIDCHTEHARRCRFVVDLEYCSCIMRCG